MKRVDDVVETESNGGVDELGVVNLASVEPGAHLEETAGSGRALFRRPLKVRAEMTTEGDGKLVERHNLLPFFGKLKNRPSESKLVRRDVSPEEHNPPEIVTIGRCSCDELCDRFQDLPAPACERLRRWRSPQPAS